jgi:hypothetical protein
MRPFHIDGSDDAAIVCAASESNPMVLDRLSVGVDDLATSKDDLVVDYILARKAAVI